MNKDREWRILNQVTDAVRFNTHVCYFADGVKKGLFTDQIAKYVRDNWHWEDPSPTNDQVQKAIWHALGSDALKNIGRIPSRGSYTFYYWKED